MLSVVEAVENMDKKNGLEFWWELSSSDCCVLCVSFEDACEQQLTEEDRTCPICDMSFSLTEPAELFYSHVEDHVVKTCPVCTQEFQPDDLNYELHVNQCIVSSEQQHLQMPSLPTADHQGQFV